MIVVADYDPKWPSVFERLRALYVRTLSGVHVVAIEHIGGAWMPTTSTDVIEVVDPATVQVRAVASARGGRQARNELTFRSITGRRPGRGNGDH